MYNSLVLPDFRWHHPPVSKIGTSTTISNTLGKDIIFHPANQLIRFRWHPPHISKLWTSNSTHTTRHNPAAEGFMISYQRNATTIQSFPPMERRYYPNTSHERYPSTRWDYTKVQCIESTPCGLILSYHVVCFIRIMGALMAKMMAPYTIYNIQYEMVRKLYTL